MTKPLTFRVNGTWGIEGVDLSTLPPQVYGALKKLCDLEHPISDNIADRLRLADDDEMARIMDENFACPPDGKPCPGRDANCRNCWLDWLQSPAEGGRQ